jgi:hypothetical protein
MAAGGCRTRGPSALCSVRVAQPAAGHQRREPRGSPDTVDAGAAPDGCGWLEGVCDSGPVAADGVGARAAAAEVTSPPSGALAAPPHTESGCRGGAQGVFGVGEGARVDVGTRHWREGADKAGPGIGLWEARNRPPPAPVWLPLSVGCAAWLE